MTDGVIHVPQVDFLNSGRLLSIAATGAFASFEPIPEARVRPRAPQPEIVSATGIAASLTVAAPRLRTDARTIAQPQFRYCRRDDVDLNILGGFPIRT
jgi:hypothetical protein